MELSGTGYFFALAGLSMAFLGFTSIVVVLHQGSGNPLSPFQVLITKLFTELGLMATAFAMLAPTLAICGMSENYVWRTASAIMLAVLVPWLVTYPFRRKVAAPGQKWPIRGYVLNTIGTLAVIALCVNVAGSPINPNPAPLAFATLFVLTYASVSFFWTYALFLHE
jgi:hydrogenase-4 membrane subunit HyfE